MFQIRIPWRVSRISAWTGPFRWTFRLAMSLRLGFSLAVEAKTNVAKYFCVLYTYTDARHHSSSAVGIIIVIVVVGFLGWAAGGWGPVDPRGPGGLLLSFHLLVLQKGT